MIGQKYATSVTPAKNVGRSSQGSCTSTPATVMPRIAPAAVSASRGGSLRQVQTLLGSSPKKAATGAAKLGTWSDHATTSAVTVPSPMNADRRQRPGVGARSAQNDSIIPGVRWICRGTAGTTLTSDLVLSAAAPPRPRDVAENRGW